MADTTTTTKTISVPLDGEDTLPTTFEDPQEAARAMAKRHGPAAMDMSVGAAKSVFDAYWKALEGELGSARMRHANELWAEYEPDDGYGPVNSPQELAEFRFAVRVRREDDSWFEGANDAQELAVVYHHLEDDTEFGAPYVDFVKNLDTGLPVFPIHSEARVTNVFCPWDGTSATVAFMPMPATDKEIPACVYEGIKTALEKPDDEASRWQLRTIAYCLGVEFTEPEDEPDAA